MTRAEQVAEQLEEHRRELHTIAGCKFLSVGMRKELRERADAMHDLALRSASQRGVSVHVGRDGSWICLSASSGKQVMFQPIQQFPPNDPFRAAVIDWCADRQREYESSQVEALAAPTAPSPSDADAEAKELREIPEYFAKAGVTEALAQTHPAMLVRQMANEILRLRALSSRAQVEAQQWIAVSERLPERSGNYLAAFENGHVAEDEFYGPEHNQWWRETHADHGKVTHWMPLPKAPEGG